MSMDMMATVIAASKYSSMIIGMGSSGISQMIAQRISQRRKVSADYISVWEEDLYINSGTRFFFMDTDIEKEKKNLWLKMKTFAVVGKHVISFSLYGNNDKYLQGALQNAKLCGIYFAGWICRFYIGQDVPNWVVSKLQNLDAEVRYDNKHTQMFARFLVADDASVDRFIVRDTDARLSLRDRFAVQEWVDSGLPFHIARDHVFHCKPPIMGGMWGAIKGAVPNITELIQKWTVRETYGQDQSFLEAVVWPVIKSSHMSHDSYCCEIYNHSNSRAFPTKRFDEPLEHLGQVHDEFDEPKSVDITALRQTFSPTRCRKQPNWIYG
jgi:hypothetical protein